MKIKIVLVALSILFVSSAHAAEKIDLKKDQSKLCSEKSGENKKKNNLCIGQHFKTKKLFGSKEEITKQCKKKWPGNYTMFLKCTKQRKQVEQITFKSKKTKLGRICYSKWGDNISMLEYCIRRQKQAKYNIKRYYSNHPRHDKCSAKWRVNYPMVEYCIKKINRSP